MFAVIKTGGKQYKVSEGDTLKIEKLEVEEGKTLTFDEVLLVSNGDEVSVGKPLVKDAKVSAKVAIQGRAKKVIVFKYKNKTRYSVKRGHRQPFTEVEITKISHKV